MLFLDDDVELDPYYIDSMEALFERHAEIVLAGGHAVLDRFEPLIVTRETALRVLQERNGATGWEDGTRWIRGHNMFVSTEIARMVGFDEKLPLYGLYEDSDFVVRCKHHGQAVRNLEARMVHLRVVSGRINEVRLGYSQFANAWYLVKKGVWATRVAWRVWATQLVSNLLKSCVARSEHLVDRRGRLRGNLSALSDLFRGRLDPENILTL